MGLQERVEQVKSESESESGSSGPTTRSQSSGDNYPKFRELIPYAAVYHTESTGFDSRDDDLKFKQNPQRECVFEEIKTTPKSSWTRTHQTEEFDGRPGHAEKVWWDEKDFQRSALLVADYLGLDFLELLQEDTRRALEVLTEAQEQYRNEIDSGERDPGPSRERTCACCGKRIDLTNSSWERVNGVLVHNAHTVGQLKGAGVFD